MKIGTSKDLKDLISEKDMKILKKIGSQITDILQGKSYWIITCALTTVLARIVCQATEDESDEEAQEKFFDLGTSLVMGCVKLRQLIQEDLKDKDHG